ncbi:MAG: thymidine phosphorylase [Xanthomonadales bacterium]|nr:thymidine phosphorylase [Xanthomonadales bacterium]
MLLPEEFIKAKRDGQELTDEAIKTFVNGIAAGQVSDAQIGAFTMAVYFKNMSMAEQSALTLAMRDSGHCLQWPDIDGPVLDKHSTGGVGDLVSLIMAPILAACGAYIPMISGRGLGHTGGTIDKLESIPGFDVHPPEQLFRRSVRENGFAIIAQGNDLAPADERIYAVRDVTATVSSIPLIVASILSKKLAEGLDGLVLDIKTGNGAFMRERNSARDLAANLIEVAELAGVPCRALITDMNQPLARNAGNALEMLEAIDYLKGGTRQPRLDDVVMSLGSEMLMLGGLVKDSKSARVMLNDVLGSGLAAERFAKMISLQGGPTDLLENPSNHLQTAPITRVLAAPGDGCIEYLDTRAIGLCVVGLGGGRKRFEDSIDHRVGLSGFCLVGESVNRGDPLVTIHAADENSWQTAAEELVDAFVIGRTKDDLPAVYEQISKQDIDQSRFRSSLLTPAE